MAPSISLFCTYGKYSAAVTASSDFRYSELVSFVCEKWPKLQPTSIYLCYGLPGCPKVMLDNHKAMQIMLDTVFPTSIDRIDVFISKNQLLYHDDLMDDCNVVGSKRKRVEAIEDSRIGSLALQHESKQLLTAEWSNGITGVGQYFIGGVEEFREVLSKFAIERGYHFKYLKNDGVRVTAECKFKKEKDCLWAIHGRLDKKSGNFFVKTFVEDHTCGAAVRTTTHPRLTSKLVSKCVHDDLIENPLLRAVEVKRRFKNLYALDMSYHHAWSGVEKAKAEVYGDQALSFDQLRWYTEELKLRNPGSHVCLEYGERCKRFKRVFISFSGSIHGFQYCRPMLFLDGTFIKSRYKGTLLAASAKDGNQGLFPVAFAVVDAENNDNWSWFLNNLHQAIGDDRRLTFISDRHKGILTGVRNVFPNAYHSFCLQHLKMNLRTELTGLKMEIREKVIWKFVQCAYARTERDFSKKLDSFKKIAGKRVDDFLRNLPLENFANLYFRGNRYGEMTSNAAESFNSMVRNPRKLPVVEMLDGIRIIMMTQFSDRLVQSYKWKSVVCHEMERRLHLAVEISKSWTVIRSSDDVYDVRCNPSAYVDIRTRTCSCREWQLHCFPCVHAVAAVKASGKDLDMYIDYVHQTECYQLTYSMPIFPIPTMDRPIISPKEVVILPPLSRKPAGRSRDARYNNRGELTKEMKIKLRKRTIRCGRCGLEGGHNRVTCTAPLK